MLVVNAGYEIYRWQVLSLLNCIKRDFLRRANIQGIESIEKICTANGYFPLLILQVRPSIYLFRHFSLYLPHWLGEIN